MEILICARPRDDSKALKVWNLGSKFANAPAVFLALNSTKKKLVRFVYVDESGISVNETTLVVADVIIDADSQWSRVAQHLDQLVNEFVPYGQRNDFIFHATELFHGSGQVFNRNQYRIERSHEALTAILAIPSAFRLPIVFGFIRKQLTGELPSTAKEKQEGKEARSEAEANHSVAFSLCAMGAETFMKKRRS